MTFRRRYVYLALVCFLAGTFYGLYAYDNRLFPFTSYYILTHYDTIQTHQQAPSRKTERDRSPSDTRWRTRVKPQNTQAKTDELQGLGYLRGYEQAEKASGVITHNTDESYPGYNLYVSGHDPVAELIDMKGQVLNRWTVPWNEAFPDITENEYNAATDRTEYLRKFHLFPNGDLLVVFEWLGLVKVDRNSRILWSKFNRAHHDLWVGPEGRIYVLTASFKQLDFDATGSHRMVGSISILDSSGNLLREISLLDAIRNSEYSSILDFTDASQQKLFHTNAIEVFTEDHPELGPAFSEGNALISMRNTNMLAVVDLEAEKVVWTMAGFFQEQHDPVLLENNNLLVFDNLGHNNRSKTIEFDPRTQRIHWAYYGTTANNFASKCCGTNQRLPNENTLITDTSHGRSFEVNRNGDIVWEFVNPHRVGEDNELVASLYALKRYPKSFFDEWSPEATTDE